MNTLGTCRREWEEFSSRSCTEVSQLVNLSMQLQSSTKALWKSTYGEGEASREMQEADIAVKIRETVRNLDLLSSRLERVYRKLAKLGSALDRADEMMALSSPFSESSEVKTKRKSTKTTTSNPATVIPPHMLASWIREIMAMYRKELTLRASTLDDLTRPAAATKGGIGLVERLGVPPPSDRKGGSPRVGGTPMMLGYPTPEDRQGRTQETLAVYLSAWVMEPYVDTDRISYIEGAMATAAAASTAAGALAGRNRRAGPKR
uniref:Uncharacterized protein n=1 Tax=Lotharella oceanica TaxID=641309 RepID=A0A7S2TSQ4_9EUKA